VRIVSSPWHTWPARGPTSSRRTVTWRKQCRRPAYAEGARRALERGVQFRDNERRERLYRRCSSTTKGYAFGLRHQSSMARRLFNTFMVQYGTGQRATSALRSTIYAVIHNSAVFNSWSTALPAERQIRHHADFCLSASEGWQSRARLEQWFHLGRGRRSFSPSTSPWLSKRALIVRRAEWQYEAGLRKVTNAPQIGADGSSSAGRFLRTFLTYATGRTDFAASSVDSLT